ncbi:dihydroxyacetone kinase subunit DhaK [Streptomyces noursei]|uniref:dihydroxyacetone kinase subunit DhaK n=1 Tax=Streptomyces noursei TaxID=1971 RepID=UPI0019B9734A|nr:dihydroxyacetone kinase subunit DhaK [Streptomyces noursei]MCZ1018214.1 dihydroxyacetone kinase subunit DhaK [Streptomyces noursei]GGW87390.1 hypothetical protein GCM10010341_04850 [Streptomyces noursei]
MGIHGEPGLRTTRHLTAAELADELVGNLLPELPEPPPGGRGRVAVLLNGLGRTTDEELFVVYRQVNRRLREAGLRPFRGLRAAAAAAVGELGGAEVGEKTLLDAPDPFRRELRARAADGLPMAWRTAAEAATGPPRTPPASSRPAAARPAGECSAPRPPGRRRGLPRAAPDRDRRNPALTADR